MDHKLITCSNNRCSFLFLRRVMVSPFTFRIEMLRVRRLAANNSSSHGIMIPSIDGEKDDFRFPKKTCPFSSDFPATCHDTGGYPGTHRNGSPNGSPSCVAGLHRRGVVGTSTRRGSPIRPVRDVWWRRPGNPWRSLEGLEYGWSTRPGKHTKSY